MREPELLEEVLRLGDVSPRRRARELEVLVERQVGDEVVRRTLEDVSDDRAADLAKTRTRKRAQLLTLDDDPTRGRRIEPAEDAEERRLAASRRADDRRQRRARKLGVDRVERLDAGCLGLVDLPEADTRGCEPATRQREAPPRPARVP